MTRARSGAPGVSPSIADLTDVAQTAADFNGVTAHLFVGTVDTTGALTYTPAQTAGDRWTVVIVEVAGGVYLDSAGTHEGPFDPDISLVSDAMVGNGGLAVFTSQSDADGNIDLTAPTVLFENAVSGFMLSNAAASQARDDTQTSTLTGSIPGGGVNIHHDFWALFGAGVSAIDLVIQNAAIAVTAGNVTIDNPDPHVTQTATAALSASRSPSVTFATSPIENDYVVLFASSTTTATITVPATWENALGGTTDVESDAHQMCCVIHRVTSAEDAADTVTFTATNLYDATETGEVVGVVLRNVSTVTPIDSANSAFDSANSVTPHVLASLTGANLSTGSLVVSAVAKDGTGTWTTPAGYTALASRNTNQGLAAYSRNTPTTSGVNVAATNITPSAGDEYTSITVAFTKAPTSTALVIQDALIGVTADNVTLTTTTNLVIQDAAIAVTADNVVLEAWTYEADLANYASVGSVSRWHKQSTIGGGHTTNRPLHINNADDVNGSDDVLPPNDVVYDTDRLWIAAGAQNYGGTNLRLNQQIDLTGAGPHIIEFEAVIDAQNFVNGWLELVVTDKPYAGAAWSSDDNAAESTPRYGFVVKINYLQTFTDPGFHPVSGLSVWDEWVQTNYDPDDTGVEFTVGAMHTVRLTFDDNDIAATIDGAAWWSDTWTLPPELMGVAWVSIGAHNHATLKYTPFPDALVSQWGGLRWRGPATTAPTIHRVPDDFVSHTMAVHSPPGTGTDGGSGPGVDAAWDTPTPTLEVTGVPAVVDSAMIAFTAQTSLFTDPATTTITYELNGNGAHNLTGLNVQFPAAGDGRNFFICEDVDPAELVAGINEIDISISAAGGGAAPFVGNVELLVWEGDTVTLVIADAAISVTTDNVTLTQVHVLVAADASIGVAADNVTLTQVHALAVQDAAIATTADNVTLTQVHVLTIADASVAVTADNVALTQEHTLVIADASIGLSADNVVLTQAQQLAIDDAAIAVTSDNVVLAQEHELVIADAAIAVTADNVALTQEHVLAIDDAAISVTADNVALSVAVDLVIADAQISVTADAVTLTQVHELVVADAAIPVTADSPTLTQTHVLAVADAQIAVTADNVVLFEGPTLVIQDAFVAVTSDSPALTQDHQLVVADAQIAVTADDVVLTQEHALVIADAQVAVTADNVVLTVDSILVVQDAFIAVTADNVVLTQTQQFTIADAFVAVTADNVVLTQIHVLTVQDAHIAVVAQSPTLDVPGLGFDVTGEFETVVVDVVRGTVVLDQVRDTKKVLR